MSDEVNPVRCGCGYERRLMNDLIRREDAIDKIFEVYEYEFPTASGAFDEFVTMIIPNLLRNLPSVEPERKKGKWIVTSEFEDCRYVKCNQCKVTQVFYYNKPLTNFCPNCGAEMKEKNEVL